MEILNSGIIVELEHIALLSLINFALHLIPLAKERLEQWRGQLEKDTDNAPAN